MKKEYSKPMTEKLVFDYAETVVASPGDGVPSISDLVTEDTNPSSTGGNGNGNGHGNGNGNNGNGDRGNGNGCHRYD